MDRPTTPSIRRPMNLSNNTSSHEVQPTKERIEPLLSLTLANTVSGSGTGYHRHEKDRPETAQERA